MIKPVNNNRLIETLVLVEKAMTIPANIKQCKGRDFLRYHKFMYRTNMRM